MTAGFTLTSYSELLQALRQRGYRDTDYQSADPARAHLVLRHDVDMTLSSAVKMAEVEASLKMRACYFILLRTELYNVFSAEAAAALQRIQDFGHEIGLHFDAALYPDADREALDRACTRECGILEAWAGRPVQVVSFHRPAQAFLGLEASIGGRVHCYQPRFFREMGYCSDSRGGWHHGEPLVHEAVAAGRALQLLTHPIWWDADAEENPVSRLDRFMAARYDHLEDELARNCRPYAEARALRAGRPR